MDAQTLAAEIAAGLAEGVRYEDPYPLTYFRPFSPETYAAIRANLPDARFYQPLTGLADTTLEDGTVTRHFLSLRDEALADVPEPQRGFLSALGAALRSDAVTMAFKRHLAEPLSRRFDMPLEDIPCHAAPRLMRDSDGYKIGPHPDSKGKTITVLLYLPPDESQIDCGTAVYRQVGEGFETVRTMPFSPNSGFCFVPAANTFHGAEEMSLPDIRHSLSLTCFVKPVPF